MSTNSSSPSSVEDIDHVPTDRERMMVFCEWCLRHEAFSLDRQAMVVAPLGLIAAYSIQSLFILSSANSGRTVLRLLFALATLAIIGGGAMHAARAVCWEISAEMRELVRLTGIGPIRLLLCKSLARWISIGCSVLVLLPLVLFALTLRGASVTQAIACGWGLLMLATLMASFAAFASVLSNASPNKGATATMSTFLLILLYHMVFWISNLLITLFCSATGGWQVPDNSWVQALYDFQWRAIPLTVMYHISQSPDLFSPLDPAYWVHFITAAYVFRMTSVILVNRFNAQGSEDHVDTPDDAPAETAETVSRPRCGVDSFFWKDAYVLSSNGVQRTWSVLYFNLAIAVVVSGMNRWQGPVTLIVGIIAECLWPVIFAMRFDSLLSAEFRQRTWDSLMLLPIDRSQLLKAKLKAVLWEHQLVWLPVILAVGFAFPYHPQAVFMTGVLASLIALLLIEVSANQYVTPQIWWAGPVQMLGVLLIIVVSVILWLVFPAWVSFSMTAALLIFAVVIGWQYIKDCLEDWHDSPKYRSGPKLDE